MHFAFHLCCLCFFSRFLVIIYSCTIIIMPCCITLWNKVDWKFFFLVLVLIIFSKVFLIFFAVRLLCVHNRLFLDFYIAVLVYSYFNLFKTVLVLFYFVCLIKVGDSQSVFQCKSFVMSYTPTYSAVQSFVQHTVGCRFCALLWVQVTFECGDADRVMSVSENELCKYIIKFMTPAAC